MLVLPDLGASCYNLIFFAGNKPCLVRHAKIKLAMKPQNLTPVEDILVVQQFLHIAFPAFVNTSNQINTFFKYNS